MCRFVLVIKLSCRSGGIKGLLLNGPTSGALRKTGGRRRSGPPFSICHRAQRLRKPSAGGGGDLAPAFGNRFAHARRICSGSSYSSGGDGQRSAGSTGRFAEWRPDWDWGGQDSILAERNPPIESASARVAHLVCFGGLVRRSGGFDLPVAPLSRQAARRRGFST